VKFMADEKTEVKARVGFDIQDFIRSFSGSFVMKAFEQQISITLLEMGMGKIQKGDRKGEFKCQTLSEFERTRGFALGIQWAIDFLESRVNEAKRIEKSRTKKEGKEGE